MICPNCGRELAEGETCTCLSDAVAAAPEENAGAADAQYYQPGNAQTDYNNYYQAPGAGAPYYGTGQQNYYGTEYKAPARTDYPDGYPIKKKYVAVILAMVLGGVGIHNLYLGNRSKFLTQLLIGTVGSLFFGLGIVVSTIWAYVEAVMIFMEHNDADANGYKIETFDESLARALNK